MQEIVVARMYNITEGGSALEFALGHSGEYPRVVFRGISSARISMETRTEVRDLMESLAEELFNFAAYAERELEELPHASSLGDPYGSAQLNILDTLDGGGRGGPGRDGQ